MFSLLFFSLVINTDSANIVRFTNSFQLLVGQAAFLV